MTMLANALWAGQDRIDEAESLLLDALERYRASPDATADGVATVLHLLGDIELTDGRHASALDRYRQAADALYGVYGDAHQRRLTIASRIAVAHERTGDRTRALRAHADAERIATALWGAEDRRALAVRMDVLEFLVRVGWRPDALARLEELAGPVGESGDADLARRLDAARSAVTDLPR
jgi:tetratricopeptide (TPR) repeat protein